MSGLPYTDLFAKFKLLADDLIETVNAASVTLTYLNQSLTTTSAAPSSRPEIIDQLGGRNNLNNLNGHQGESTNTNLIQGTNTEVIKARIYWNCSPYDTALKGLNIKEIRNVCKMITYIAYTQNILNATTATIDGKICKLIREPVPHGMQSYYVECYWEISN